MSAVDPALRIREAAGRRARNEAAMLDRMVEDLRLASFRSYLAATVVSMSALVPEVLALAGSDVAGALQRLRPAHSWPEVTAREDQYGRTGPATNRMVKVGGRRVVRPAPLMGDAVIADGTLGPWIEAKIFGGSLDVKLRNEAFELSTQDGTGYIRFTQNLPETVVAACRGRPVGDVLEHSLLGSRGYVIARAANVGGACSISFNVGRLDLEMPWRA